MKTQGESTLSKYDECNYKKSLKVSTAPGNYRLYSGNYENCNKCKLDKFHRPFDPEIVDAETELSGRNRPLTHCPEHLYNPNCTKSKTCTSTFDKSHPVILPADLCPIVKNNLKPQQHNGLHVPQFECGLKN